MSSEEKNKTQSKQKEFNDEASSLQRFKMSFYQNLV